MQIPTPDQQPTLTVEEAGELLGISRGSAYEAARTGELPTIRIGRRLVVPTAALRRMLALDEAWLTRYAATDEDWAEEVRMMGEA
jgi:excisionase family DNA binding protein